MTSKWTRCLAALLVLPLLLTSCINFDGQTVSYRYDRDKDQLRIFQVDERIYAEGKRGRLTDRERQQIASLIDNQMTFFFDNWLFVYNDEFARNQVAKVKKKLAAADDTEAALLNAELDFHKALLASIHVTNGQFFFNDKKELCGCQAVTVSNVSRLIETANRYISLQTRSEKHTSFEKEQQRQIREFARKESGSGWMETS